MASPGAPVPTEVPNSEAILCSSDVNVLRAALAAEMRERKTMERALSIAAKEVKNLRQHSAKAQATGTAAASTPSGDGAAAHGDALEQALDAQTHRAASLERQLAMSKEELKRVRASIVVSEHATQRRIADSLAARMEDATAAEAAAAKAAKALDGERRAKDKAEAALAAESGRRAAAECAAAEAKAEVLRLNAELAGQAAAGEVHLVARLKAETEAAHQDAAVEEALRDVTTQLARMRQAMAETSRGGAAQVLELSHRAEEAERRLEAESKQRQAAEAAIVAAVQMRQRHQQAVEEGQSAAVSAAEEAASIALQRAHDESHRRMAAEQALAVANQELKWRREAAEQAGQVVHPPRPETPPATLQSGDAEPGSPASVMLHQRQELEFALAVATAEVKKWRALATSRSTGDAVVVAHHRDALEAERQQAARLQTALTAAQSQVAQLRTSEARAQAEVERAKAAMDEEQKKRSEHEAALSLAAQHIRRLQRDNQELRSASISSDATAASSAAQRMDEAAAASVAAANRERRLREDRAKAKMSGPDSAVAAAVAAAEAIAAAEAAAQQRLQHRAGEEARARETAQAAMRAAADASAWVAQGGGGSRPPGFEAQERAWEVFVATAGKEGGHLIRASDIPWPDVSTLVATLEADAKPGGLARPRSVTIAELRTLQARWHPDRFAQRFGSRLEPKERDAVLRRVTEVASRINALRGAQDEF
jgi:hypothetical protein